MTKARRSGIQVRRADVPTILAMVARGDRKHDIAAWFGLNQGRIAEVEDGDYGTPPVATDGLPPSGSPGLKARELRASIGEIYRSLRANSLDGEGTLKRLERAMAQFDKNE